MTEAPEIPEVEDSFGRKVALSIATIAVILAVVSMKGDNAKGDGLLAATKASSQWAYYQAKSIKGHTYKIQKELLESLPPGSVDESKITPLLASYGDNIGRYEKEKTEIMTEAKRLEGEVASNGAVDDRSDMAGLLLQIAIVIGSIAILVSWPLLWYVSLLMASVGSVVGASAFFL